MLLRMAFPVEVSDPVMCRVFLVDVNNMHVLCCGIVRTYGPLIQ